MTLDVAYDVVCTLMRNSATKITSCVNLFAVMQQFYETKLHLNFFNGFDYNH